MESIIYNNIPAPPHITILGDHQKMKEFVKAFAPPHGYLISVQKSYLVKGLCNYVCHRGGVPETIKDESKESKSLKINCPFKLKAKLNRGHNSWTLHLIDTKHNHPPNFDLEIP
ncbi:hypothetical protein DFH28DRAFT_898555, partial [Melampsora americana]